MSVAMKKYGWKPDLPDQRDHLYAAPARIVRSLPKSVDLRPKCPPEIYDQGELGSCTANAIGCAIDFNRIKQGLPAFMPSRLFIYYNEREMEGTVPIDAGAMIRDGIKSVNTHGACPEVEWPYDISKFAVKPPEPAYVSAEKYQVLHYMRVIQNLNHLKACLAAGYPFVFGFSVYESFETGSVAQTGIMSMPGPREQNLGGHAVLAVGYDDSTQMFVIRNSWGAGWGQGGHFFMPYQYMTTSDLADDFWTIRLVE